MTQQERNKRRALLVRRWAANGEIWMKRREIQRDDPDETAEAAVEDASSAELPEMLG